MHDWSNFSYPCIWIFSIYQTSELAIVMLSDWLLKLGISCNIHEL